MEIWSYQYNNETVYLVIPDCCDQMQKLYSADCQYLCGPSGGFGGGGDGKCTSFYDVATEAKLIWKK